MREKVTVVQKIRLLPESPYSVRQITRTLEIARGSFYRKSVLEIKDKKLSVEIERIHEEEDDTLGHKKLAPLLHTEKNRILRVMKKYGIKPRKRKDKAFVGCILWGSQTHEYLRVNNRESDQPTPPVFPEEWEDSS